MRCSLDVCIKSLESGSDGFSIRDQGVLRFVEQRRVLVLDNDKRNFVLCEGAPNGLRKFGQSAFSGGLGSIVVALNLCQTRFDKI